MLSNKEIVCPENLLRVAKKKKEVSAVIVNAGKKVALESAKQAVEANLIIPFLKTHCSITLFISLTCIDISVLGKNNISHEFIQRMLLDAINSIDRYFPAFQYILWAGKTSEEALNTVLFETKGEA